MSEIKRDAENLIHDFAIAPNGGQASTVADHVHRLVDRNAGKDSETDRVLARVFRKAAKNGDQEVRFLAGGMLDTIKKSTKDERLRHNIGKFIDANYSTKEGRAAAKRLESSLGARFEAQAQRTPVKVK